uniref:Cytochrome b5 domain containing 2 n=1 Tax=Astyanax mexicanus TaxID=7994 RepID=A0A8B9RN13_ASTMX
FMFFIIPFFFVFFLGALKTSLWWAPQGRWLLQFSPAVDPGRLLHQQELSQYSAAEPSKGLYLSLLGRVFDVGKGRKHYGPQGGYRFFTGQFHPPFTFLKTLTFSLYLVLNPLCAAGRLIGRFYTETGEPTDALRQVEASLAEGLRLKAQAEEENQQFPSCNSEWSSTSGGRVWCSTKSGGVHRDWTGVPRMLFSPGSGHTRCVCVQPDAQKQSNNPNLKEYKDCSTHAESCLLSQD